MSIFIHHGGIKSYLKKCPISSLLILTNTVMYLITVFMKGNFTLNLVKLGGLVPSLIKYEEEYYRLLAPIFLHGSFIHYLMNTFFGIMVISAGLERLIGSFRYLIIYICTGLISSLFVFYFEDPVSLTVGASGAIYGVMGCFLYIIFLKPHLLDTYEQRYVRSLLLINLIFTFFAPSISILGHLGGLIGGLVISPLFFIKE